MTRGASESTGNPPLVRTRARCPECGRVFDLTDEDEANEWYYGHDCEPVDE